MLESICKNLISILANPQSTQPEAHTVAQRIFAVASENPEEAEKAMKILSAGIVSLKSPYRASYLALLCGAILEDKVNPQPLFSPLLTLLSSSVGQCDAFIEEAKKRYPSILHENGVNTELLQQVQGELEVELPLEAEAFKGFGMLWRPTMALCLISHEARGEVRKSLSKLENIAPFMEGVDWLIKLVAVLDEEPLLVIEPSTRLGFRAKMSGVADNFQLHMLIMDVFPLSEPSNHRRISEELASIARGDGSQQSNESVTGVWNLYDWRALQPNKALPIPGDQGYVHYWIWGEGTPADIPLFDQQRVVLLGPPAYERTWTANRIFDHLKAQLNEYKTLTSAEVDDWLERIVTSSLPR